MLKKINIAGHLLVNEPMCRHTSFKIGGPADAYLRVRDEEELKRVFALVLNKGLPCFILGGGANILVSDRGIRGLVLDLSALKDCRFEGDGTLLVAGAGADMSRVCEQAREMSLTGLEFAYSMPGSVGGSITMNARCYGSSMSDRLAYVDFLDEQAVRRRLTVNGEDFGYKRSPFQKRGCVILTGAFRLAKGERREIDALMRSYKEDREKKGHFRFPCAGSVFKNNRDFGQPTGRIVDSLGMKGTRIGDAQISEFHANIIVNRGRARAGEVMELIRLMEERVRQAFGFSLEREILLVGEW